ncbi:permease-like cell division protein FtsX [Paenibacillus beijingensis]|uniref:Cell division protein FtsX n=1 Tax=Paenibacillus beijingensis TaxID=1126833 RepID=A0A0D5NGG9_9BACL|nr:permease-like cell division protein FtsX [Paenibacillus beijingensis]AJY74489.1 cell division protein FtsX [Paenibacillus beijingensis]
MKASTFVRHLREGSRNVIRNGWMSFASMSSIFISLFILGVFMLLALNVNHLAAQFESQVEIRAYLQLGTEQNTIDSLETKIRNIPEVKNVTFVSKEEGLKMLQQNLGKDGQELLQGYSGDNNPLPDSFTIELFNPQTVAETAAQIEAMNKTGDTPPFLAVKYGKGTVETLFRITRLVRNVGLAIVLGLAVTAMFLISNTIKITILNRRREIGIMKLVGATNSFIRWPFFVEGALIGFISSVLTAGVVLYGYYRLVNASQVELGLNMITLVNVGEAGPLIAALIIGIGTVIGIWGSTISVRKYLKV